MNPTNEITLNELLAELGFDNVKTVTTTFCLPLVSMIGLVFCSVSAWIFYQKNFSDPTFFYYRLLNLVYIVHSLINIPYGLLFSPRFFPNTNTYVSAYYMIFYNIVINILFHYEDVLQICILLTRMKIFSSLLQRYFTLTPRRVSFIFFVTCLVIDFPVLFAFKVGSFGSYVYDNEVKKNATFYYFASSEFSISPHGILIMGVTSFFLNIFMLLVVGVTLNIVSFVQYKRYLRARNQRLNDYEMISLSDTSNTRLDTRLTFALTIQKDLHERKVEKNMLYMILTLCTISIGSRVLIMSNYIYFFFYYSFADSVAILYYAYILFSFLPCTSIFIFYSFNKMFREELNEKVNKVLRRFSFLWYRSTATDSNHASRVIEV
jgi:Co/Zn/Cd efflux system component